MNLEPLLKNLYRNPRLILFTLIFLYLFLEVLNITLPGLYDDEAFAVCGTLQIIKKIGPFIPSVKIFNTHFPLMLVDYEAAMESYLLLPFLSLFGVNVVTIRLVPIFAGALGLILLYFFIKRFFDTKTALLSIVLLVINPVFLLESKLGLNSASILHFAMMAVLLCFFTWYQKRKISYFICGVFFLSIGLSIRAWYAWFVVALLILGLMYNRRICPLLERKKTIYILVGAVAFSLGSILFIVYNFTTRFSTWRFVIDAFFLPVINADNQHYVNNFLHRLRILSEYISGQWSFMEQGSWFHRSWNYPEPFAKTPVNNMLKWTFYAGFLWLVLSFLFKRSFFSKKRILFLCGLILIIMVLSPLVPSRLDGPHLFILYPFLMITIAVALVDFAKRNKYLSFLAVCIFSLIMLLNIKILFDWQYYFKYTGGIGNNSDAIYALADWLKTQQIKKPILCDWGMQHNLIALGDGVLESKVFYGSVGAFPYGKGDEDVSFIENCREYFINPSYRYIFHAPIFTNMDRFDTFARIAREMNKNVSEEKIFYQKDGKPVFIVYSVN